jgi:hypothetical protein
LPFRISNGISIELFSSKTTFSIIFTTSGDEVNISVSGNSYGTLSLKDGNLTYTSNETYIGLDYFTIEFSDGKYSGEKEVEIEILESSGNVIVNVLENIEVVQDVEAEVVVQVITETVIETEIEIVEEPQNGSAILIGNDVLYTPNSSFIGEDRVTIVVQEVNRTLSRQLQSFSEETTLTKTIYFEIIENIKNSKPVVNIDEIVELKKRA